jgi:hypothetical protein
VPEPILLADPVFAAAPGGSTGKGREGENAVGLWTNRAEPVHPLAKELRDKPLFSCVSRGIGLFWGNELVREFNIPTRLPLPERLDKMLAFSRCAH